MRGRGWVPFVLLVALSGCAESAEPRAQWTVEVSTDAAIPLFGDRLLVEVLTAPGELACEGCRRMFGIADSGALPLSFGVTDPGAGPGLRVRARLYRSSIGHDAGAEAATAAIDVVGVLGDASEVEHVALRLPMSRFGVPPALEVAQSCDPETGSLAPEAPLPASGAAMALETASWEALHELPCSGATPDGMSCIPGGAFLLGDGQGLGLTALAPPTVPERLVHMKPFFLDRTELSVGDYRNLLAQGAIPAGSELAPIPVTICTYKGANVASNDELPLNCIDHEQAKMLCAAWGKRLPTEAEWEYAASGRGKETRYPWGSDDDVCAHAVVGRAGLSGISTCLVGTGIAAGLAPVGSWHDVSGDAVSDLAGNVSEWVADGAAAYDAQCFQPEAQLLEDPVCEESPDTKLFSVRGGNYGALLASARVSSRIATPSAPLANVGVRCARSN